MMTDGVRQAGWQETYVDQNYWVAWIQGYGVNGNNVTSYLIHRIEQELLISRELLVPIAPSVRKEILQPTA